MNKRNEGRSIASCLFRTAIQTVVIWTLALAVGPYLILRLEERTGFDHTRFVGNPWAGAAIFLPASVLGLVSGWTMAVRGRGTPLPLDPTCRLVVSGPYRWVRNPMAIAGLAQGAGVGVMLGSWSVLAYVAAGFLIWNWGVRVWEERDLLGRFGADYAAYRSAVRCWWPRLRPFCPSSESRSDW